MKQLVDAQVKVQMEIEKSKHEKAYDDLEQAHFKLKSQLEITDRENLSLKELIENMKADLKSQAQGDPKEDPERKLGSSRLTGKVTKDMFGQVLTHLRKGRMLHNAFKNIMRVLKQKAFNQLMKNTVYSKKASGEAGLRVKARLLVAMRERYKDVGVRRSFLRWMIFINKTFLRDCITKVALTARVNHHTVLFRMRKLIEKSIKVQLPEAAKKLRRMGGLHVIDLLVKLKQLTHLIESFNKVRPGVVGRQNRLLINLLNNKAKQEEAVKLNAFHNLLTKHRAGKNRLGKLISAQLAKLKDACAKLREFNTTNRLAENLVEGEKEFFDCVSALRRAANANLIKVFDLGNSGSKADHLQLLKTRCDSATKSLLADALKKLRGLNKEAMEQEKNKNRLTKNIFTTLKEKQDAKLKDALERLRKQHLNTLLQTTAEEAKANLSKAVLELSNKRNLDRLVKAMNGKLKDSLNRLRHFTNQTNAIDAFSGAKQVHEQSLKNKNLRNLFDKIARANRDKEREALNKLRDLHREGKAAEEVETLQSQLKEASDEAQRQSEAAKSQIETEKKERKLEATFGKLKFAQEAKERQCFGAANIKAISLSSEEMLRQQKEEAAQQLKMKSLNNLFGQLSNCQNRKLLEALKKLRELNADSKKTQEAASKLAKKCLDRLKQAQDGKCRQVLQDCKHSLKSQAYEEAMRQLTEEKAATYRKKTLNHCFDRLVKAQQAKQREAFHKYKEINALAKAADAVEELERVKVLAKKQSEAIKILEKLKKAQNAKAKEAFTNLNERMANQKLAEILKTQSEEHQKELQKKTLGKTLQKLKDANLGKLAQALALLRQKAHDMKSEEAIEAFKSQATQELRKKAQGKLLDQLLKAQDGKQREAMTIFREAVRKQIQGEQIEKLNEEAAKRISKHILEKLRDRIKLACDAKTREMFTLLHDNCKSIGHEEQVKSMKEDFFGKVKGATLHKVGNSLNGISLNNLRWAFENIKNLYKELKSLEDQQMAKEQAQRSLKENLNRKTLDRLKHAQEAKERVAFHKVKEHSQLQQSAQTLSQAVEEARLKLKEKTNKLLLEKLRQAQIGKLADALSTLRNIALKTSLNDQLQMEKELASKKLKQKSLNSLLDRLLRCSTMKELLALKKLRDLASQLKAEENESMLKNETAFKLQNKNKIANFNRLKTAQEGKMRDALARLKDSYLSAKLENAISESKEELARKKLENLQKNIFKRLKAAQEAKMREALTKAVKNNKAIEFEQETKQVKEESTRLVNSKTAKDLMARLKNSQALKQKDALDRLKQHKQVAAQELKRIEDEELSRKQTQDRALKSIANRMKNAQDAKLADSLSKLRDLQLETAHKNEVRKLKKFGLLNALIKACMTKSLDAFDKLVTNYFDLQNKDKIHQLQSKLAQEKERSSMAFLLDRLRKAQIGKTDQCLKELRGNANYLKSIETLESVRANHEKKTRIKLLLGLIKAQQNKQLYAYLRAKDNYKDTLADENEKIFNERIEGQKKQEKNRAFLGKLVTAQNSKKHYSFKLLCENSLNKKFEHETELKNLQLNEQKKSNLAKLLFARIINKRDDAWYKLINHANIGSISPEATKKNRLVSDLVNAYNSKQDHAFRLLVTHFRVMAFSDLNERSTKNKLIRRLIVASEAKQTQVFFGLQRVKNAIVREEREKMVQTKQHLDKMFEFGIFTAHKNKESCYLKLASFASEQKRIENLKKSLLNGLVRSCYGKLKNAGYIMRQFNLHSWSEQRLNETIGEIETEKGLGLKRKLFKKLYKTSAIKAGCAFRELRYFNNAMNDRFNEGKKLTENIVKHAVFNVVNNRQRAYYKLAAFSKKNKEFEQKYKSKLRFIVGSMHRTNTLNESEALSRLRQLNSEAITAEEKKQQAHSLNFNKLVAACSAKKQQVFNQMRKNNNEAKETKLEQAFKSSTLLNKLIVAQNFKQLQTLSFLKSSSEKKALKDLNSKKKLENALTKLANIQRGNAQDVLRSLLNNKNAEEFSERAYKSKSSLLLNKLVAAQQAKTTQALNIMKLLKENREKNEVVQASKKFSLIAKLVAAFESKERDALAILIAKKEKEQTAEIVEKAHKTYLLHKLIPACQGKTLDAFNRLKFRAAQEKIAIESAKASMITLLGKLSKGQNGKLHEALKALMNRNQEIERETASRKLKGDLLANKLVAAQEAKKIQATANLRRHQAIEGLEEQKQEVEAQKQRLSKQYCINRLIGGQTGHLKDALDRLRNFLADSTQEVAQAASLTKFIINKIQSASNGKLAHAYFTLKGNLKDWVIQNEGVVKKRALLVSRLVSALNNATADALFKLRNHHQKTEDKEREDEVKRMNLLNKLASAQTVKQFEAFSLMNRNSENITNNSEKATNRLKFFFNKISSASGHKLYDAFEKMKDNNTLCAKIEKSYNDNMIFLLNRIMTAHSFKLRQCMLELRSLKEEAELKEQQTKSSLGFIVNRISRAAQAKQLQALQTASINAKDQYIQEETFRRARAQLVSRMVSAQVQKTEDALNKFRTFNRDEMRQAQEVKSSLSKLINRIAGAATGKAIDALDLMREHQKESESYENVRKTGARNVLARLAGASSSKCLDAFRKLFQNASVLGEDNSKQDALKTLLGKLSSANASKSLEALRCLEANKARKKSSLDKFLIRLIAAQLGKMRHALDNLKRQQLENQLQAFKLNKLKALLLNKLASAAFAKQSDAFKNLSIRNKDAIGQEEIAKQKSFKLIDRLKNAQVSKMQEAFKKLSGNKTEAVAQQARAAKAKTNLAKWVEAGCRGKTEECFKRLRAENDRAKQEEVQARDKKEGLVKALVRNNQAKLRDALAKLQGLNKDMLLEETKNLGNRKLNFSRLVFAQNQKQRQVLKTARDQNQEENAADLRKTSSKNFIFNRLVLACNAKCSKAFKCVSQHSTELREKEAGQLRAAKLSLSRLVGASTGKASQAYQKLKQNKTEKHEAEKKAQTANEKWMHRLIKAQNGKQRDAYFKLLTHRIVKDKDQILKEAAMQKILNNIDNGFKSKVREAALAMKLNKDHQEELKKKIEEAKNLGAKYLINRVLNARTDELARTLEKLVCNALNSKLIEQKKTNALMKLVHSHEMKLQNSLNKMILQNMVQKSLGKEKGDKLTRILQLLYTRLTKGGYDKLLKNAYQKQKLVTLFARAQTRFLKNAKAQSYDKLKGLLKKNDTVVKIMDSLQSKVRLRLQQGFDTIKLLHAIAKRDKLSRSFNQLHQLLKRLQKKRKAESFYEIKSRFHNDNPWFKRTIDKLSLQVPCSVQVAFWKIKVEKNFGYALLPVETSIKLKQFVEIFEKRRMKTIQSAFARVDVGRPLTESMLNMSYISQSQFRPQGSADFRPGLYKSQFPPA